MLSKYKQKTNDQLLAQKHHLYNEILYRKAILQLMEGAMIYLYRKGMI